MNRRGVLTGGAALAAATILPALPAMAVPKRQTFVLFTRYGYGYVKMRVFEGDMASKKGMANTKTQWSGDYLIKADADMDIPRQSEKAVARLVKRHVGWVEDLKKKAIAFNEPNDMMFRRARTMHYCESKYGPCRLVDVTSNHEVIGDVTFFHAYDAKDQFRGSFYAGRGSA